MLRGPGGERRVHRDRQAMPVFHEEVALVAELGRLPRGLLIQPGVGIHRGGVGGVTPGRPAEVHGGVARIVGGPGDLPRLLETLLPCPGLEQGPIHGEVLIREEGVGPGLGEDGVKEGLRDVALEGPLASHCIEHLQDHGPERLLRGDRGATGGGIELRELREEPLQDLLGHRPDRPEGMAPGHPLLRGEATEARGLLAVGISHAASPLMCPSFRAHHTRSASIGKRERPSLSAREASDENCQAELTTDEKTTDHRTTDHSHAVRGEASGGIIIQVRGSRCEVQY